MALDESTDKLDKLESNGVTAYIDGSVIKQIQQYGEINIDYVVRPEGAGYMIKVGSADCGDSGGGGCSGCG